jgi:hypothetical protein
MPNNSLDRSGVCAFVKYSDRFNVVPVRAARSTWSLGVFFLMRILLLALMLASVGRVSIAQDRPNPGSTSETPIDSALLVRRSDTPKLRLDHASRLARSYLRKHNVSTAGYYLVQATYTSTNFGSNLVPCWRLLWTKSRSQSSGNGDLEAYVFMNGAVFASKN